MGNIVKKPIILKKIYVTGDGEILVNSQLFAIDNILLKNLYLTGNLDCNFLDLPKDKIEEKLQLKTTVDFNNHKDLVKYIEDKLINKKYKGVKGLEYFEIFIKNFVIEKEGKVKTDFKPRDKIEFSTASKTIEVSIKILKDKYILTYNN